jgi:hypothetical protein
MKQFVPLYLAIWFFVSLFSCEDRNDGIVDFSDPTDYASDTISKILRTYSEKWELNIRSSFTSTEWETVSSGYVFSYTEVRDIEKTAAFMQYLENNIFSLFPEKMIKEYFPPKIFLVDSLYNVYTYDDQMSEPPVYWEKRYTIPGNVTGDYLAIGDVGERFDPADPEVKFNLISLIVERLLFNHNMPDPDELRAVTEKVADQIGLAIYSMGQPNSMLYPYWDGDATSTSRTWIAASGIDLDPSVTMTLWQGLGILNMGRRGDTGFSDRSYSGIRIVSPSYSKGTLNQDFADFAALIFTKTPAEREAFFAAVEANTTCMYADYDPNTAAEKPWISPDNRDLRYPFGGKAGADAMREKVNLVKQYFKQNLNFDLPD